MTYVLGLLAVVALLVGCAVAVLFAIAHLVEILPPLRARDGDENADRRPARIGRPHPSTRQFLRQSDKPKGVAPVAQQRASSPS